MLFLNFMQQYINKGYKMCIFFNYNHHNKHFILNQKNRAH